MHFTVTPEGDGRFKHTFGFGAGPSGHWSKRDDDDDDDDTYGDEYFTSGGIDVSGCFPDTDNIVPDPVADTYPAVEYQLECTANWDLGDTYGFQTTFYDTASQVIGAATILPYQGDSSPDIGNADSCPRVDVGQCAGVEDSKA